MFFAKQIILSKHQGQHFTQSKDKPNEAYSMDNLEHKHEWQSHRRIERNSLPLLYSFAFTYL